MSKTTIYLKNEVRIYATDVTEIAQKAMDSHQTLPLPSLVIATAIAAFAPLSVMKKYGRTVATIKADGSVKDIIVESNVDGEVRALIGNPFVATEYDDDNSKINSIPLQLGVGTQGILKILNEVGTNTFGSDVKLVKGDIVTDLAWYFDQSEQIRTAVITNVELESKNEIKRAYSVIFQLLPKANEADVLYIENMVKNVKLKDFNSLDEWAKELNAEKLSEEKLIWKCKCSELKMKSLLNQFTEFEKEEIIKEHGKLEVRCNFCNTVYDFTNNYK